MLNVRPNIDSVPRMTWVSLGRRKKVNPTTHGIKQAEPKIVKSGFEGPRSPSRSLSRIPANIATAETWTIMNTSNTKPSIERTTFHGDDGCAKVRPGGGGVNGVVGRPCMMCTGSEYPITFTKRSRSVRPSLVTEINSSRPKPSSLRDWRFGLLHINPPESKDGKLLLSSHRFSLDGDWLSQV